MKKLLIILIVLFASCSDNMKKTLVEEDSCNVCNTNDPHDPHYGNPYGYHDSGTPPCEWKIITLKPE